MKHCLLIVVALATCLQLPASPGKQTGAGAAVSHSEKYFAESAAISGLGLTPVRGFQDEGISSSIFTVCDQPVFKLGNSSKPVAFAGFGIGAVWSSANRQCTILYCDVIPEQHQSATPVPMFTNFMTELSANAACGRQGESKFTASDYILSADALGAGTPDSVCVYRFPNTACMRMDLDKTRYLADTKFPGAYCLGVDLADRSGVLLRFLLLLDDKGYRHKDKYIGALLKSIRFEE